jgi:hypothetical protein
MSDQHTPTSWRILADRFIWSDEKALSLIPEEISDEEIQKYLFTFHNDNITIEEIKRLRAERVEDQ